MRAAPTNAARLMGWACPLSPLQRGIQLWHDPRRALAYAASIPLGASA